MNISMHNVESIRFGKVTSYNDAEPFWAQTITFDTGDGNGAVLNLYSVHEHVLKDYKTADHYKGRLDCSMGLPSKQETVEYIEGYSFQYELEQKKSAQIIDDFDQTIKDMGGL